MRCRRQFRSASVKLAVKTAWFSSASEPRKVAPVVVGCTPRFGCAANISPWLALRAAVLRRAVSQ